ncbi:MAG: GNVR domain-containing protein, partial [Hyphomicrobium sp.]
QIDPRQKSITNLDSVVEDLKGDQPTIESEVEIIQSRPIILRVIETLNLRADPEFVAPSMSSRMARLFGLSSSDDATKEVATREPLPYRDQIGDLLNPAVPGKSHPERDEVVVAFLDRLKVARVRNTLLIDIRYSASDAVKAATIANTVAEVYLNDQLDSKKRAASTASQILEKKLDEMRVTVAEAERKVEQWKAENRVYDSEGQILSEKQLARLMEQTVTARNATAEARAKFEQAQKLARAGDGGGAIGDVLQSHTIRLLKEQLGQATRKAAELNTKYGSKHPDMLKVRAEVAEAQAQLSAETERLIINLKNEYEQAEARERQLAQSLNQLKDQEAVTKDAGVDLKDLERDAATSKQLFEALLTRYKQTTETQSFQLPDARLIEHADTPLYPASPKRKQLVLIAAAGGLVLGLAMALLLELMAPGIARPEDFQRVLEVAHLSSVPPALMAGDTQSNPGKAIRFIVAEPASAYADAIRDTRRALDMRRTAPGARVVLVASSLPGEGAEIIASNLAHTYAMTGVRVLLVDADLRRQPLTRMLAPERTIGLFDQLTSGAPVENAVLRDGLTGLHFLPASGQPIVPKSVPELLSSPAIAQSVARLKDRFDVMIMTVPPLLPVIDGRIIADYADQILFIMRAHKTPKALAKKAIKSLGFNGGKIAGAVLTDAVEDGLSGAFSIERLFAGDDDPAFASSRRAA